jgi:hypothetical protein
MTKYCEKIIIKRFFSNYWKVIAATKNRRYILFGKKDRRIGYDWKLNIIVHRYRV